MFLECSIRSEVKGELWKGQWKKGKWESWVILQEMPEFVIIDQGTGFLHRFTVWSRANNFSQWERGWSVPEICRLWEMQVLNCRTDPRLCGLTQGLGGRGSTSETLIPYESDPKSTLQDRTQAQYTQNFQKRWWQVVVGGWEEVLASPNWPHVCLMLDSLLIFHFFPSSAKASIQYTVAAPIFHRVPSIIHVICTCYVTLRERGGRSQHVSNQSCVH